MFNPATALKHFRVMVYGVTIALVTACVALMAVNPGLAWVVIPALAGGVVMAAVLFLVNPRYHPAAMPGGPRPGHPIGVMNIAHVNVAGFGGLALVATSALVAFQYQFTTVAMAIAAVGGVLVAIALVRYRRRHPTRVLHV